MGSAFSSVLLTKIKNNTVFTPAIPLNPNLSPENFFQFSKQRYIPLYAIDKNSSVMTIGTDGKYKEIIYYKPDLGLEEMSKLTSNIINVFFRLTFNSTFKISKVILQFNNQPLILYVGPGLLLDENGKTLCCVTLNKEILNYIHSLGNLSNDVNYVKFVEQLFEKSSQIDILNVYGAMMVSTEFSSDRKYKNIFTALTKKLVEDSNFKLDLIVTSDADSRIFNIGRTVTKTYSSMQEKVTFQKAIWEKVLT